MKVYTFKSRQFLPITVEEAWDFLSSPANLKTITPDKMGFDIVEGGDRKMYSGQIVQYIVKPMLGIPMHWVSELKHVNPPFFFVDEQRKGPYKLWYHQHRIEPAEGGVIMEDEITYAIPLGILGRIAHFLFVKRQLNQIFSYRTKKLEALFGSKRTESIAV